MNKEGSQVPYWLKKQLEKAYYEKNRYEIVMLNQCWYAYLKRTAQQAL